MSKQVEDPRKVFFEYALHKLNTIACPKCKDTNLFACAGDFTKIHGRRAILFKCICQSCVNIGSIVIHEALPEELQRVKNENANKIIS